MKAWRLVRNVYAKPDGEAARLYGGRWNFPKTAVVYASSSLSLAILEFLTHLDSDLIPNNVVSLSAQIPTSFPTETISTADLPANWRTMDRHPTLQRLGMEWVQQGQTAILFVPSAVVPDEHNILLNPGHSEFGLITWSLPIPFSFDPRLFK